MEKKKLLIGIFTDAFLPMIDGVGMVVDNYARNLVQYADVYVFAPRYINNSMDDSVFPYKVIRCQSLKIPLIDYSLPLPKLDWNFEKTLNKYHLDLVHIHSPFTIGKVGVKYAKRHHIPVIGTMHSQYKQDFYRAVRNDFIARKLTKQLIKVYDKCDECWAVNSEVAKIFYEEYDCQKYPKVFNNATEMESLSNPLEGMDYVNSKYHLKKEKVCLFVGRLNALKNVFFIIDVLEKIQAQSKIPFKMFFVGTGQDEEELKKYVKKKGLDKKVLFVGKITDRKILSYYYARSDLFVFPSLYDASSIVQIEAASQHTPTIFLEGSATSCTVTDNVNGYIEKNDVNLFAKRIIKILENDQERKKIGDNAFRDLYKSWSDNIKEVYANYEKLIKNKQ